MLRHLKAYQEHVAKRVSGSGDPDSQRPLFPPTIGVYAVWPKKLGCRECSKNLGANVPPNEAGTPDHESKTRRALALPVVSGSVREAVEAMLESNISN